VNTTLEVRDLVKDFPTRGGLRRTRLRAVDHVSFTVPPGCTLGLVGESGSGKSTIARVAVRLEKPTAGQVVLRGPDGNPVPDGAYRNHVQMVFQDPFASLLDRVSLPAGEVIHRRPHELSGGQRQRVAIARALAPGAKVIVADEPVSMLDVSIRLGILRLLARLQREQNLAVLYITHDLATARHFSDHIIVLYRGRVVERGPADDVILNPQHPYTRLLAAASPDPLRPHPPSDIVAAGTSAAYDHYIGCWEDHPTGS
jgi:peptide/nickel transport system ATP-binding protein